MSSDHHRLSMRIGRSVKKLRRVDRRVDPEVQRSLRRWVSPNFAEVSRIPNPTHTEISRRLVTPVQRALHLPAGERHHHRSGAVHILRRGVHRSAAQHLPPVQGAIGS